MEKWLKCYAIYKFSTSPDSYFRTTLLNTDVPILYITLNFITYNKLSDDLISTQYSEIWFT